MVRRCTHAWLRCATWLTVVAALLGTVAEARAQGEEAPAPPAATENTTEDTLALPADDFAALQRLLEIAPSRQIGQPGNARLGELIERHFAQVVAEQNPGDRFAAAQQALAEADAARDRVTEASLNMQRLGTGGSETAASFWMVRYTLEDPTVFTTLLLLLAAVFALVAWLQNRRQVYYVSAVIAAAAVALPIVAAVVQTPTERARQRAADGDGISALTWDQLYEARDEEMREAMHADRRAAEALTGLWQHGQVRYPMTVFEPGEAHLSVAVDGESRRLPMHQLQPNLVDPSNLPEAGATGPLVYINRGRPSDLPGKSLDGAVVLMEFDSGRNWINAVELGAEVIVFLGPERVEDGGFAEAQHKFSFSPVDVPRFYVQRDVLAEALGERWRQRLDADEPLDASVMHEPGRWVDREVASDWLFIPGTGEGLDDETRDSLVHIQAYRDSNSIVPELAPGAQGGSNLVLLLRLLERYREQPPARNVMLSVINGHAAGMRGETMFNFAAFADPSVIRRELEELDRNLAKQRFIAEVYGSGPGIERIRQLRTWIEQIGQRQFTVKDPIVEVMELKRNTALRRANHLEAQIEQARQAKADGRVPALTDAEIADHERRIEALESEGERYLPLLRQFSRFGQRKPIEDLRDTEHWERLTALFEQTAEEARQRAEALAQRRERMMRNLAMRRRLLALRGGALDASIAGADHDELFDRGYTPLPSEAVFCLDLAFGTDRLGFFALGYWTPTSGNDALAPTAAQRVERLAEHTLRVAEGYTAEAGLSSRLADTMLNAGGQPWQAHLASGMALGSRVAHEYARPALTLTTVQDSRAMAFSPQDTPEAIDRVNFDRLMQFARGYLPRLVDAPGLEATRQPRGASRTLLTQLTLHTLDDFSVELATAKTAGALLLTWPGQYEMADQRMYGEVAPFTIHTSDSSGQVTLRSRRWQDSSVLAFDFADAAFRRMSAALDLGEGDRKHRSTLNVRTTGFHTRNLVMFLADKVDLFGATQALTLMPAAQIEVLKGHQNSAPVHYSVAGVAARGSAKKMPLSGDGTAAVFVEPGQMFKLIVQGMPVINASEEDPEGMAFASDVGRLRNLSMQPAQDMHLLNQARLAMLVDKGVTDEVAAAYNDKVRALLEQMDAARRAERPDLQQVRAEEARGLGFRSYTMTVGTINDLIKAVVVVLGLIIPAAFFLMKLVTPFTSVNAQLGAFGLLFALLTLLLLLVHPAFQIADTPMVVILAFIILGLALFVISVIVGRFNTTMTQAIEESQMSEGVDAPRGRLAGVAFMVGVNNMKRRRIRTTLTAATVVLVTFTSLSVMSVGRSSEPVRMRMGDAPAYNGFVFTRPGMGPLDATQMQNLRAHFENHAEMVRRVWVQERSGVGAYLPMQVRPLEPRPNALEPVLNARAVLGLEQQEDGFIGSMPLVAGRWFSSDKAREIVLSAQAGELLGYTAEDLEDQDDLPTVRLMGRKLTLVGLVDDDPLRRMTDLGDTPLLPLKFPTSQDLAEAETSTQEAQGTASLDPASSPLESMPGVEPFRPIDLAIVPVEVAAAMNGAAYRALSVKYIDRTVDQGADQALAELGEADGAEAGEALSAAQRAWNDAKRLVDFQHVRLPGVGLTETVDAGDGSRIDPGQYAIASRSTTQVGGVLKVAIPIGLGATIIFNTMLGAVMERRREISIYNAIGLNPTHVMVFFLAESLVFGLVGAVAGYLIGQILSVLITQFNLFELNLNYSSLSVMLVIFITIATVLLSTIYPATMAARAAVPSGQRKWSLPQPEGDEIRLTFPFLYDDRHVLGVCAYLRDYMQQNSEASTGKFLATPGAIGMVPEETDEAQGERHDRALAMLFDVAPAPFDLGVNQRMEVYAFYDARVGAYMLGVHLTRISGQKNNWVTVNQPFLEALRKRLLGWRSQRAEVQQSFCDQGQSLFADARDLPTTPPEPTRTASAPAQVTGS
ncbi:MAG: FtsX-like permease family protein [Phycisphaeraceae bacterium]